MTVCGRKTRAEPPIGATDPRWVDAFEPRIRELLAAYPAMPTTVIAERIGSERGLTVLTDLCHPNTRLAG